MSAEEYDHRPRASDGWSLSWVPEYLRERLVFPLSIEDHRELAHRALWCEQWDAACVLYEIVRDAYADAIQPLPFASYARAKANELYYEAHGEWGIALTIWHVMQVKADREKKAKDERAKKRKDAAFYKSIGVTPKKGSRSR